MTGPQDSTLTGVPGSVANQYNWAVYGAGKFSVAIPHVSGLSFFTKVGPVWRAMSNQGFDAPGISGARSYWTVVYGGGFQYVFSTGNNVPTGFSANLQWLGIPGYSGDSTTSNKVFAAMQPNDNLLVAGLGIKCLYNFIERFYKREPRFPFFYLLKSSGLPSPIRKA